MTQTKALATAEEELPLIKFMLFGFFIFLGPISYRYVIKLGMSRYKSSTKAHEPVSGETSLGNTVTDSTTSKKRKRTQMAKKTVTGDVLITDFHGERIDTSSGDLHERQMRFFGFPDDG
nr:hypothetical protein [Tanacetum cinerariifolium]